MAVATRDRGEDVREPDEIQAHADDTRRTPWPADRRLSASVHMLVLLYVDLPGILDLLHCSKKGRRGDPCRTSIRVEEQRQHRYERHYRHLQQKVHPIHEIGGPRQPPPGVGNDRPQIARLRI